MRIFNLYRTIDIASGKMYWTDYGIDKIKRSNLDGTGVETLISTGLNGPFGLALDIAGGKMYWTDFGTNKIQRSNLNGSVIEDLVITGLSDPYGIALDVFGGKMYWTDIGTDKIQRANFDGTSVESLVTTGLSSPYGIALDVASGKMYWTDRGTGKVQRANLDGSGIEDLITRFIGVFDGNGHLIRHFSYEDINRDGVGIFGHLGQTGKVQNVYLEDVNVTGFYYVGSLVGLNEGKVSNCSATGKVLGEENVGGLVGMNEEGSVIENCSADVAIEIKNDDYAFSVGGLVGYNFYGIVTNSFARGIILGSTDTYYTGGLAGFHRGGKISGCYANVDVSGFRFIGGLIGQNEGDVNSCYSTGDVNCAFGGGGLVGRMDLGVVDCYATGNVNVQEYAGGLIGWDLFGGAINCYSTGTVNGTTGVGGLVGNTYDEDVVYQSCFWNIVNNPDVNGIGNATDANVTGKTTAQMQTESTFTDAGWDFVGETVNGPNDIWDICEGTNYPKLVWQIPAADFVCPDGVNFKDYSFLAEHWLQTDYGDVNGVELTGDGKVDLSDFALFGNWWGQSGCGECGGADYTGDGDVGWEDAYVLWEKWLWTDYGDCGGAELTGDGMVDEHDLEVFSEEWLEGA
jgi:hypothetical protein